MRIFIILLAIAIVCATGYYLLNKSDNVSVHSLLIKYEDLQALCDASDMIVVAEINRVNDPFIIDRRDYYMIPPDLTKDDFMPSYAKYIISEVKVDKILKGTNKNEPEIEVLQEVSMDGQNDDELEKVNIFKEKEKHILFLKYYTPDNERAKNDFKTPKYMIAGLYQGQFEIVDDMVRFNDEQMNILNYKNPFFFSKSIAQKDFEEMILACTPND